MFYLPTLVSLPTEKEYIFAFGIQSHFDNQFLGFTTDSSLFSKFQSSVRGIQTGEEQGVMVIDHTKPTANQWSYYQISSFSQQVQEELALRLTSTRKSWGNKTPIEVISEAVEADAKLSYAQVLSYCAGYGLLADYDFTNSVPVPYKNGVAYMQPKQVKSMILVDKDEQNHLAFVNNKNITLGEVGEDFEVTLTKTVTELDNEKVWQLIWEEGMEELDLKIASPSITKKVLQVQIEAKDLAVNSLVEDERLNNPSIDDIGISILEQNISIPHVNLLMEKSTVKDNSVTTIEDPVVGLYTYAHCVGNKMFNPNINGGSHRITSLIHKHKSTNQAMIFTLSMWPNLFED